MFPAVACLKVSLCNSLLHGPDFHTVMILGTTLLPIAIQTRIDQLCCLLDAAASVAALSNCSVTASLAPLPSTLADANCQQSTNVS